MAAPPPFVRDARALVTEYLAFKYDETYVGTPTDNETASLLDLNNGYRRYMNGDYVDETGTKQNRLWSFLEQGAEILLRTGTEAYNLPDAYEGNVDKFIYAYNTLTVREDLKMVTPSQIRTLRRDNNIEGQPIKYAVQAKDFAAATGSTYEWICHPKPEGATVTSVTTTVTRVTGPDFHDALVGTTIEITGETDGTVQSVTDANTLVSNLSINQATATEAFYDNGLSVDYSYRIALADLTDSASVYPAGLLGTGALIIQAAKMLDEQRAGAADGSETSRFYRMMGEMVRRDKVVIPGSQNLQRRIRQGGGR